MKPFYMIDKENRGIVILILDIHKDGTTIFIDEKDQINIKSKTWINTNYMFDVLVKL